jgi:hypothetical protein
VVLALWIFISVVVVLALARMLWNDFAGDGMQRLNDQRRSSCRLVGKGELVDGKQHIPVAMALSWSTLYYENDELEASLDLSYIEEVEYADELVTGQAIGNGKVMRLRCFSRIFEFVVDGGSAAQWQVVLPAVRLAR